LLAEVEDKEHRIAELRRQFVRRSAVDERWQFHRERCVAVLEEMLDKFALEIVGLDAVEIRKRAEVFVDSFTHRMRTGT
jgi:predicted HD phosphohydrolase